MDCKLILCMPAGFPSGCGDAFDHMIDRLRDGKSPIGFCALSDGSEYDGYDIEYSMSPASSRDGWRCPPGRSLYHGVRNDDGIGSERTVTTFCYESSTPTGVDIGGLRRADVPSEQDATRKDRFPGQTDRQPGTPAAYSASWQRFDADLRGDGDITIRYAP